MADVKITYEGNTIASMSATGTKTLLTAGKYCDDDITVDYVSPGGGGDQSVEAAIISGTLTGAYSNDLVTSVKTQGLANNAGLTSINLQNCTAAGDSAFRNCSQVTHIYLPSYTGASGTNYVFGGMTSLQVIALPSITGAQKLPLAFQNDTALTTVDLGSTLESITNQSFSGCSNFDTLILRRSTGITAINNTNVFNGTKFASGGAGGTVYIPEALYNHLGDNTSLDYKAATNWSTYDAYGTITWAKIEGSYYETHYADGTAI